MKHKKILIYGANGYTGQLLTKHLIQAGIKPILAGRSQKVNKWATKYDCEYRIFSIEKAAKHLFDIDALVNTAGPFSITQKPLIEACIGCKTHYLDVCGSIEEVKTVFKYHNQALAANVALIPAAGFGITSTEIAARKVCREFPDCTELDIVYAVEGGVSRGTLKSVLKNVVRTGLVFENDSFISAKPASKSWKTLVYDKQIIGTLTPWRADIFTLSQHIQGIQKIYSYAQLPNFVVQMMHGKWNILRKIILRYLCRFLPEGPNEKQLQKGQTYVKVRAKNKLGIEFNLEMKGPEAYLFTVYAITLLIEKSFQEKYKGFCSPSQFGTSWLLEQNWIDYKISRSHS